MGSSLRLPRIIAQVQRQRRRGRFATDGLTQLGVQDFVFGFFARGGMGLSAEKNGECAALEVPQPTKPYFFVGSYYKP